MGELMGGMVPRIQDDVLICLSGLESSSGAEGGGSGKWSLVTVLPIPAVGGVEGERSLVYGEGQACILRQMLI